MAIKNHGTANWKGGIKDGGGTISTKTAALQEHPYGFNARFEGGKGTNPEELVGAAHAGCYAMALSLNLGEAGYTADNIDAKSTLTLEEQGEGFAVTKAHIEVTASVPGIDNDEFQKIAAATKDGCPISKLLTAELSLDATLA